jgi:alkanesulfonate monooxygenase SsuD/methylene tetrahydromethanopterin reductase-like flavin-dependent oxidoreductase (luciferase family)
MTHGLPPQTICRNVRNHVTVYIWALAADKTEDALHHALSRERWRVDRQRGRLGPLQNPDHIAAQGFDPEAMATIVAPMRERALVGDRAFVGQALRGLAETFNLDELVINTWTYNPDVRRRSYALIAEEFRLE